MTPLEIALIVVGGIVILISFRFIGKKDSDEEMKHDAGQIQLTEEEQQEIKKKIDELVNEACEEAIVKTDDYLSKISNEKILAVNEFSDQILEKINANHQEVVFLYHMLNDKEEELKKAVAEINTAKKRIQEIIEIAKKGSKAKATNQISQTDRKEVVPKEVVPKKKVKEEDMKAKQVTNDTNAEEQTKKINTQLPEEHMTENEISISAEVNHNDEILDLFQQGKTIIDISKELNIGQGEVKLVIDLYQKKK